MSKKSICSALVLFAYLNAGNAATEAQIYGKVHASIDYADNGLKEGGNVSNNSSRIGFKGSKDLIRDLKAVWKYESGIDVSGEQATLSARNRYVGISGDIGTLLLGIHDTPLKQLSRSVDLFNDTVGDSRALLGTVSDPALAAATFPLADAKEYDFNSRAKNAIVYHSPIINGVQLRALHSTDFVGAGQAGGFDQRRKALSGVSLGFDEGPLMVALAYENRRINEAFRVVGRVKSDQSFISFTFESLSSVNGGTVLDRNAYAFNAAYHLGLVSVALQYVVADDYEDVDNSGGNMLSLGFFQSLSKRTRIYFVYASTNNSDNALFNIAAGGHGDTITPTQAGESIGAGSFGIIHKF